MKHLWICKNTRMQSSVKLQPGFKRRRVSYSFLPKRKKGLEEIVISFKNTK